MEPDKLEHKKKEAEDFKVGHQGSRPQTQFASSWFEEKSASVTHYCHAHLLPFSAYPSVLPLDPRTYSAEEGKRNPHIYTIFTFISTYSYSNTFQKSPCARVPTFPRRLPVPSSKPGNEKMKMRGKGRGRRMEGRRVSGVSRRVRRYLYLELYASESGHGNREIGGMGMTEIEGEGRERDEPMCCCSMRSIVSEACGSVRGDGAQLKCS
jgi:hypothetical protein